MLIFFETKLICFFVDISFVLLFIVLGVHTVCDILAKIPIRGLTAARLFTLAAAAMITISAALASRNYDLPKQNLIGVVEKVAQTRLANERVLAIGYAGNAFNDYFDTGWTTIMTPLEYADAMDQPGSVLIVVAFPDQNFRAIPQLDLDRRDSLTLVEKFYGTLGDGSIYLMRRDQ